jgi:hypothetical protein
MNSIAFGASKEGNSTISRYSLVVTHTKIGVLKILTVPLSFLYRNDPMPYASNHAVSFAIDFSVFDQFGLTSNSIGFFITPKILYFYNLKTRKIGYYKKIDKDSWKMLTS